MKKLIKEVLYRIGRTHGYLSGVWLGMRLWLWKLMNGFPSKDAVKTNPELQKSLAETISEDVCGRVMEAEMIIAGLLKGFHDVIEPHNEYSHGSIAAVGAAIFNPHHPDYNNNDVKFVLNPDVPLRDRVVKLTKMVEGYNDWCPGTLYRKLQFFASRPAYTELLSYFKRIGLPDDIEWL